MPFFDHAGVSIFYTDQGQGIPVCLLHGGICDSHDWSFQIPVLLNAGFRVIALDHRGHGRSSVPADDGTEPYAFRNLASDAVALLKHLDAGPAVLVGHSMSSIVASIIANEHPEVVRAAVYVHPIYCIVDADTSDYYRRTFEGDRALVPEKAVRWFETGMYRATTPDWVRTWTLRRVWGASPDTITGCLDGLGRTHGEISGTGDVARAYMQKRKGPRLTVCTSQGALAWEREIGLRDEVDEIHHIEDIGTFVHIVTAERLNRIMMDWFKKAGLTNDR